MELKVFVLTNKRTYRRGVRVFVKGQNGKVTDRLCQFTTEHLVNEMERNTNARTVAAQFTTKDEVLYHALLADSAYGKDFTLQGDPEGKLKEASLKLSPDDIKKATLANLFGASGLKFDVSKPIETLEMEYALHIQALSGAKTQISPPAPIPHQIVNVGQSIAELKQAARQKYEEDYGEKVPEVVYDDLAFLDGMSNPEFDAEKYIQSKLAEPAKVEATEAPKAQEVPEGKPESIHELYFKKFGKNVPVMKKNDVAWIKGKLNE